MSGQLALARTLGQGEHLFTPNLLGLRELIELHGAGLARLAQLAPHAEVPGLALTVLLLQGQPGAALLAVRCDPSVDGGPLAASLVRLGAGASLGATRDAALALSGCVLPLARAAAAGSSAAPQWALLDVRGRTRLTLSIQTSDGSAQPIIPEGVSLPASGEVVLTSSTHEPAALRILVRCGARHAASACALVCSIRLPMAHARPRGVAQVHLRLLATEHRLYVRARDTETGAVAIGWVDADGKAPAEEACEDRDTPPAALPDLWRWQSPYVRQPSLGWCCAGGRLVRLPHEQLRHPSGPAKAGCPLETRPAVGSVSRGPSTDEVDPGSTASKVWPGAWMLAACLPRFLGVGIAPNGGPSVIELGAGTGMPGLVAHTLGAGLVHLTDLAQNLQRLQAACAANAVQWGTDSTGGGGVHVAELDWQAPLPTSISARPWDLILAADCVFWTALFDPLLRTLAALCRAGRTGGCVRPHMPDRSGSCAAAAQSEWTARHGHPDLRPPPCVLLSLTNRLGRADDFCARAVGAGWRVELVASDDATVHPTCVVQMHPPRDGLATASG